MDQLGLKLTVADTVLHFFFLHRMPTLLSLRHKLNLGRPTDPFLQRL